MDDDIDLKPRAAAPGLAPRPPSSLAPPWVHGLVRLMDEAIQIPGTKFRIGWDAIIGMLVPAVGDAATALSHVALLYYAFRAGVPPVTIARMVLNVAIDELWGSVPIVGDLFDAGFRANRKNLTLIEQRGGTRKRSHWSDFLVVGAAMSSVVGIVLLPLILVGLLGGAIWHWLR
ncbi:MAG TPA: DUF4112 domain-containing protein [Polyangiales bacterium]|nr:DUF4112 domain-containing protein [Polyangiales bacterium]